MVEAGLSPANALTTATLSNATALRRQDELGSIVAGKLADLILLPANPLNDIRNTRKIEWVIHGGRVRRPADIEGGMAEHSKADYCRGSASVRKGRTIHVSVVGDPAERVHVVMGVSARRRRPVCFLTPFRRPRVTSSSDRCWRTICDPPRPRKAPCTTESHTHTFGGPHAAPPHESARFPCRPDHRRRRVVDPVRHVGDLRVLLWQGSNKATANVKSVTDKMNQYANADAGRRPRPSRRCLKRRATRRSKARRGPGRDDAGEEPRQRRRRTTGRQGRRGEGRRGP